MWLFVIGKINFTWMHSKLQYNSHYQNAISLSTELGSQGIQPVFHSCYLLSHSVSHLYFSLLSYPLSSPSILKLYRVLKMASSLFRVLIASITENKYTIYEIWVLKMMEEATFFTVFWPFLAFETRLVDSVSNSRVYPILTEFERV